jgi:hypothetical protein
MAWSAFMMPRNAMRISGIARVEGRVCSHRYRKRQGVQVWSTKAFKVFEPPDSGIALRGTDTGNSRFWP